MAAPIKAGKKTVLGKTAWWIVPTLTTTGPLVTEVNSVSGLNISGYLLGDQDSPGGETPKVELPKLLMETTTTETLDATKVTIPDFRFVWDPQASAAANDKKAWALLKDGYSGFLVSRDNVVSATEANISATQFINWYQVNGSIGVPKKSATDASGIYVFDVSFACLTFGFNVAVA